jgi:hypothetical protein
MNREDHDLMGSSLREDDPTGIPRHGNLIRWKWKR